jgi:hypothetical protein
MAMAASDAEKRAKAKYRATEKGREVERKVIGIF